MSTSDARGTRGLFVAGEPDEGTRNFREKFEREPFLFRHRLCGDPRFEMSRIRTLAKRLPRKIGFAGNLPVEKGFTQPAGERLTFDETLDQLEAGRCWIILKKVQDDPEYGPLLGQCLAEVEQLGMRALDSLIESRTMSLIMSSPGQVTPYHIDADCNFLFQIRGRKTFYAFNGRDRSILSEQEEERFWAGDLNAAQYRKENQSKAWAFAMEPGNGVHVPVIYPHWVQNGDSVSVSLSINFRFHGRLRGDVYRMNHLLRKAGMHPRSPGESKFTDRLKVVTFSPARSGLLIVRRMLHRG